MRGQKTAVRTKLLQTHTDIAYMSDLKFAHKFVFVPLQVIYLDTDVLLLDDIEKMWRLFDNFSSSMVRKFKKENIFMF